MFSLKISVCLPVYNASKHIKYAINSVLSQDLGDFELIIVDDNSNDNTLEIIHSYQDQRIKVFKNPERLGQVHNYNKSISYAAGEFIKPMHHDDILELDCLSCQLKALVDNPGVALVFNDSYIIDYNAKRLFERVLQFKPGVIEAGSLLSKFLFQLNYNFVGEPPVVMFRRNILSDIGLFNPTILAANDIEFWTRINMKYKCFYLKKPLVSIRMHQEQSVARCKNSIIFSILDSYYLFSAILKYDNIKLIMRIMLIVEFFIRIPLFVIGRWLKYLLRFPPEILLVDRLGLFKRQVTKRASMIFCMLRRLG